MRLISPRRRNAACAGMALLAALFCLPGSARADLILPYYNTAGDQLLMTIFQPGGVFTQVPIQFLGYPIAARDTIWVGHRDDAGAVEYDAAGTPTGNVSAGGNNFSQLLDGTTDGIAFNYGVECCGVTNSVTRAGLDWSGQAALFNLPDHGTGITYDTTDNTLWVSLFTGAVNHYDLLGNLLGTFGSPTGNFLVGLAYEQATDTLWGKHNGGNQLFQMSKSGVLLDTLTYAGANTGNDFGGEIPISATTAPEPSGLAIIGSLGLIVSAWRRRRRTATS